MSPKRMAETLGWGDTATLARRGNRILKKFGKNEETPKILPDTKHTLLAHRWPNNVLELKQCIEHIVNFMVGWEITPESLPQRIIDEVGTRTGGLPLSEAAKSDPRGQVLKSFLRSVMNKKALSEVEKIGSSVATRIKMPAPPKGAAEKNWPLQKI